MKIVAVVGLAVCFVVVLAPVVAFAAPLPFLMAEDFDELDLLAWRIEQGQPDPKNPLAEPEKPWDSGGVMSHGTVLRDPVDGLWKAWQVSSPQSKPYGPGTWTYDRRLTYFESKDGVRWTRPALSLQTWPVQAHTNILLDVWCSYASVNIDARRDWPYEMFIFRDPNYGGKRRPIEGLPLPPGKDRYDYGLYRYRSKDGKKWEVVAGPLKLNTSDSCYIYRFGDGNYVAYHKTPLPAFPGGVIPYDIADGEVRVLGRRTSKDGLTWSDPTALVLTPDWRDPADTQFMEICPVEAPGGFIASVTVYHDHPQTIDLQWAASRDGVRWWRPERRPALANPPLGEYGGGMIWPMRQPLIDGGHVHVYYAGTEGVHGDLYNTRQSGPRQLRAQLGAERLSRQSSSLPDHGALCRATWTAGRLWALAPAAGGPYVGTAVTKKGAISGKQLALNYRSRLDGELRVELLDGQGAPIQGFSALDCQPLQGDEATGVISWKGGQRAPTAAVRARFLLKRTFLYGLDWRD